MPVYNEEKNVSLVVQKYQEFLKEMEFELIFVEDGGSNDKTKEEIIRLEKKHKFVRAVFSDEKGYGISIFTGLKSFFISPLDGLAFLISAIKAYYLSLILTFKAFLKLLGFSCNSIIFNKSN